MPLDLLDPEDRAFVNAMLQEMFEPLGAKDFIIVAIVPGNRAFAVQATESPEPMDVVEMLRRIANGNHTDTLTLDG